MKYGYARVSTEDQNPALQLAALKKTGCRTVFKDEGISGATAQRPALLKCLKTLQAGDTLIVWKLDRLGRSLRDLIHMLDDLKHRGVKFRSLTEAIDTDTATVCAPDRACAAADRGRTAGAGCGGAAQRGAGDPLQGITAGRVKRII